MIFPTIQTLNLQGITISHVIDNHFILAMWKIASLVDDEFGQHCEVAAGALTIVAAGDGEGNHVDVQLDLVATLLGVLIYIYI